MDGGYDYDGAVIAELESKENEPRIAELAQHIEAQGIKCIAITGVFSPMRRDQELRMEAMLRRRLGADF